MLGARPPSAGSSHPFSVTRRLEDDIGFVKSPKDTEYNQETIPVSGGDGEALQMRPAAHPFGVLGEEDDRGDGNAVNLGAAEAAGGRPNAVGTVACRRSKLQPLPGAQALSAGRGANGEVSSANGEESSANS